MGLKIPEIDLYKTLTSLMKYVEDDYNNKSDKKTTLLWHAFGEDDEDSSSRNVSVPLKIGNMNLFDAAVDIFIKGASDEKRRNVEVSIGYNMKRQALPSFHIMMPAENPKNAGIGDNEGYASGITDKLRNTYYRAVTQDASCVYNILITSDNPNEVLIMYNFLKAIFLSFKMQLELRGFQNVMSGGSDLTLSDDLMPTNIMHRNFTLSFDYDYSVIDMFGIQYGTNLKITGTAEEA